MRKSQFKFTATSIAAIRVPDPSGKTRVHWDSRLPGFGIQASGTTKFAKFIAQGDLRGHTIRIDLGPVSGADVDEVRNRANKILLDIKAGVDPREAKPTDLETKTVRMVLDDFLKAKERRPATVKGYRANVEKYLTDWLDIEMRTISYAMVAERHAKIQRDIEAKWSNRRNERVVTTAQALLSEINTATIDPNSRPTVAELSSKLRHAITDGDEAEIRSRMASLVHASAKFIPSEKLKAVTTLPPEADPEHGRNGKAQANGALGTLGALWNFQSFCVQQNKGEFPPSPVKLLTNRRGGRWFRIVAREKKIKVSDMPRFYRAVMELSNPIHRDYVLTLLFTGLRATECASLEWSSVDFADRSITIPGKRTKNKKTLPLPMTDILFSILMRRRQVGVEKFVFPSGSKRGFIGEPRYPFTLIAKKTGLDFGPHDLRRTWSTYARKCSVSLNEVEALMNHSLDKENDISKRYDSLDLEDLREPAQKIADKIKDLCKVPAVDVAGENITVLSR